MGDYEAMMHHEVCEYWQALTGTLEERGLLRQKGRGGRLVLPRAMAIVDQAGDRVLYVLDMQRLGGVAREQWLDRALWRQWRAALRGRRVAVADGYGLVVCVARTPGQQVKRLPTVIPLDLEDQPAEPYVVTLGYSTRGRVNLDLAEGQRAILVGGTSGGGKTNMMQVVVLALAAKHPATEYQVAIVDTKEVDFGSAFARLPQLFAPIAHSRREAEELIERVEAERLRRQALMARVGARDWRECEGLGLLLLVVDEAADFAGGAAMETLIEIARKGRAMGISLIVGTQNPSSDVIDGQVRANLPTAVAFQCRTHNESRVILGRKGAEELRQRGLALTFTDRWEQVQVLRVDAGDVGEVATPEGEVLGEVEQGLVRYALEELGGAFVIGRLYEAFKGEVSKYELTRLAQRWERRGWLTEPARTAEGHKVGRRVTDELEGLISCAGN